MTGSLQDYGGALGVGRVVTQTRTTVHDGKRRDNCSKSPEKHAWRDLRSMRRSAVQSVDRHGETAWDYDRFRHEGEGEGTLRLCVHLTISRWRVTRSQPHHRGRNAPQNPLPIYYKPSP